MSQQWAAQRVGIVAGRGCYPATLSARLLDRGASVFVAALSGQCDTEQLPPGISSYQRFPVGSLIAQARFFHQNRVQSIYLAGGVARDGLVPHLRLDRSSLWVLLRWRFSGDDRLLRHVADSFAAHGVPVADPSELMGDHFAGSGLLAGEMPQEACGRDLRVGWDAAKHHGARDRGQAVIVREGRVLCRESTAGTDALLSARGIRGGVIVKVAKPGQDRRFDMPSIGPTTIELAAEAGVMTIGIEAHQVLVFERESVFELCERTGVTLVGIDGDSPLARTGQLL